jgi:hypothetical protein
MSAVSHVTFAEENDAKPACACAIAAGIILSIDQVVLHYATSHTRTLYIAPCWIFVLAAILAMNCVMNCIWHPIPKERRDDGQLTNLHLNETPHMVPATSAPMFSSLEERISSDDEESVGASQVELRDPIQWRKMTLVSAFVLLDILFLITWSH